MVRFKLRTWDVPLHWSQFTALYSSGMQSRLPTVPLRTDCPPCLREEFVNAGGLLSYGTNIPAMYRRAADYVDKIARGTKITELPIEQPTKFELVINLKTAAALGLDIPVSLLARTDEVIE